MKTPEELRTLVAEEVMGWEDDVIPEGIPAWSWKPAGYYGEHKRRMPKRDWNPLESWAGAGRVIERMHEVGWELRLEYHGNLAAAHYDNIYGTVSGYGEARHIPKAISLAALRALGVEVE